MKRSPVKSWIDVNEVNPLLKNKPKHPNDIYAYNKPDNHLQKANTDLLDEMMMSGFKPKWYAVIHFNDGGDSKRQQYRRLDIDQVTNDLWQVKNFIYTEAYGSKWQSKNYRAKSIWGVEYGKSKVKPHLNLVIEELPYPYDTFKSFYVLLDRYLPDKIKCLWRRSAHLQPINFMNNVTDYITKESDYRNSTIIHCLTDYFIK